MNRISTLIIRYAKKTFSVLHMSFLFAARQPMKHLRNIEIFHFQGEIWICGGELGSGSVGGGCIVGRTPMKSVD